MSTPSRSWKLRACYRRRSSFVSCHVPTVTCNLGAVTLATPEGSGLLPYLFQIGDLRVPTHGFFVLAGVIAATLLFFYEAQRRNMLDERLFGVIVGTLFCGAIGARLATLWIYIDGANAPSLVGALIDGGKSILGGLSGAYIGALLFKRVLGYQEKTGDLFAPAVALGMAIGRWGCFLTEQIGTPTALPWGIRLDAALLAQIPNCPYCVPGVRLHPSFIYEIFFHSLMFVVLWWYLRPRLYIKGEMLKIYLLAYALFRFGVEYVRGNTVVWEGMTRSQLFLLPTTALLICYFVRRWRRGVYRLPSLELPDARGAQCRAHSRIFA
ncbi:prolipoprotein diacylglyceryl transferase [Candidatus Gracilibacteria bacterium]|nr:prolipoprotein diacylglyceryl transferase [Candidatus Gracilibacteria bacterium]